MDNNVYYKLTADKYELNNIPQRQSGIISPSEITISVIIPTKERIDGLKAVLDSLPAALEDIKYEVIICQDRENSQIADLLKNYRNIKQVIYDNEVFRTGESFSWSKLINYGFAKARGNWLIFGSDDIVFYPQAFSNAIKKIEHDRIGAISFLHKNTVESYGGFFDNYGFDTLNGDRVYINFGIINKNAFKRTQGFDERYKFYWADVDICMQMIEQGYEITFSEDSLVDHVNILDSVKTGNSNKVFKDDTEFFSQKWRNSALFDNKNPLQKIRYFLNDIKVNALKSQLARYGQEIASSSTTFLIDGVIFDLQRDKFGGISYVWINYLKRIATSDLRDMVILLDRENSAPDFPGLRKISGRRYSDTSIESRLSDAAYVDEICRNEGITHFISTYYTYSHNCYNIIMLHDFIPEVQGYNLTKNAWPAKKEAILNGQYFLFVSENTKKDFLRFYPEKFKKDTAFTIYNGVSEIYRCCGDDEKDLFRKKYNLKRPFFLVCGYRSPHKNVRSFLKSANLLNGFINFEIIFTGGEESLEKEYLPLLEDLNFRRIYFSLEEMPLVYNCAEALIFLSNYEGFGLPILEAMKCGCPVVTCKNSAIPEVAGDAAFYVDGTDIFAIKKILIQTMDANEKSIHQHKGFVQANLFSWDKSFNKLYNLLNQISDKYISIHKNNKQL